MINDGCGWPAFVPAGHRHSWPNPAVGCVLVSADNRLIAVGSTQAGGRPHAEAEALLKAEQARKTADLKAGTAYVTLEPCAHKGRGPACADLLVQAGLGRIVYAVEDPDERVNGQGHKRLIKGGLTVQSGLYAAINKTGLSGFLSSRRRGRPLCDHKNRDQCRWLYISESRTADLADK